MKSGNKKILREISMERFLLLLFFILVENGYGSSQSGKLIQRWIAGWSHGVLHSSGGSCCGGLVVRSGSGGARFRVHKWWIESGRRLLLLLMLRDSIWGTHDASITSGSRGSGSNRRGWSLSETIHSAYRWIAVGWHSVAVVAAVQVGESGEASQSGHSGKSCHPVIMLVRSVGRTEAKKTAFVQVERRSHRRRWWRCGDWWGSAHAVGCRRRSRVDWCLDCSVLSGRQPRKRIQTGSSSVMMRVHASDRIGHGKWVGGCFVGHARLRFATGAVFVIGVLFHVQSPKTFGLVDEWALFVFVQQFPLGTFI